MKLSIVKNKTLKYYLFGGILALLILYVILAVQIPAVKMRIVFFAFWFFAEIYLWITILKSFKDTWKKKIPFSILLVFYWLPACILGITMGVLAVKGVHQLDKTIYLTVVGVCVIQYLIKFLIFTFVLIYDVVTAGIKIFRENATFEKGKRRLLRISLGVYVVSFILMIYGTIWGAENFKIREITIDGYGIKSMNDRELTIVLLSDLHLATWRNSKSVERAVQIVNDQQPDFIFLTGDLVQFVSEEFAEYMSILSQLKATQGIYSVLGNHDYGRYARFKTDSARKEDVFKLVLYQTLLGWKVLNNESVKLYEDSIPLGLTIAGVEFYSPKRMFVNEGDLTKTFQNVDTNDYVILLSHDPQAWDDVIRRNLPANLTLSGHTHGMQLGIYTNKIRFSPAAILYKHWGGLYEKQGKLLYVNVGLGSVGFPARVGVPPEITVIRLK
ncbi:MAG: metallophosphoesterase [Bacteroidetes bacterium]|nr:metallophosphoesterase [Bacteroidota bacterium]MCL2303584.1 metallophosphoesterase [Lentimicrobiaceae bacterium]